MRENHYSKLLRVSALLTLVALMSACSDGSDRSAAQSMVSARIATQADLLSGPLARGVPGDYVLENENLRIIIQKPGRQ